MEIVQVFDSNFSSEILDGIETSQAGSVERRAGGSADLESGGSTPLWTKERVLSYLFR